MSNLIQQLKKNKRPLMLMNSELQNAMLSMSPKEFICLQHTSTLNDPQWTANVNAEWAVDAHLYNVYRLRPDYEDELEIKERLIVRVEDMILTDPNNSGPWQGLLKLLKGD